MEWYEKRVPVTELREGSISVVTLSNNWDETKTSEGEKCQTIRVEAGVRTRGCVLSKNMWRLAGWDGPSSAKLFHHA